MLCLFVACVRGVFSHSACTGVGGSGGAAAWLLSLRLATARPCQSDRRDEKDRKSCQKEVRWKSVGVSGILARNFPDLSDLGLRSLLPEVHLPRASLPLLPLFEEPLPYVLVRRVPVFVRCAWRGDSVWLTRTLRGNRNDASLGAAAPRWNSAACVLGVCASALLREGHLGCDPLVSLPTRPIGRAGSREKERKKNNSSPPIPPPLQTPINTRVAAIPTHGAPGPPIPLALGLAPPCSSPSLDVVGFLPSSSRRGRSPLPYKPAVAAAVPAAAALSPARGRCLAPWSPEAKVTLTCSQPAGFACCPWDSAPSFVWALGLRRAAEVCCVSHGAFRLPPLGVPVLRPAKV